MSSAFSGHLLNAFGSTPAQSGTPVIVTNGAMSFDARAHSTPGPSISPFGFAPITEDNTTAKHIAALRVKLNKKLGPEYISQRPGPCGGPKLTYAEGWKMINLANEVFGFNGWSSSIVSIATDFMDYSEESKRFNVGVTAIVRVTLRDGTYHEDVGYGLLENAKSKASALDKCKKEATTDALKRTLRNFGNLLGNCLYDKSYAQEVVKIKVPPAKFDKNELYRRPEFEERTSKAPAPAVELSPIRRDEPCIKTEHEDHQPETPITYVPRHLRQEMAAAAQQTGAPARALSTPSHRRATHTHTHASTSGSGPGTTAAPANRDPPSVDASKSSGLTTPIQTPVQVQRPAPPRAPPPRPVGTSPSAQMRSAPECSVSFAEPLPPQPCAGFTNAADQDMHDVTHRNSDGGHNDEDEDAFPFSTQDGAFFAAVDLGEGDLGRPVDFEEGTGGVSMMDASVHELEPGSAEKLPAVVPPQPRPQVRDLARNGSNVGLSSGGPPKTNSRNDDQAQPAVKPTFSTSSNVSANADPSASADGGQPGPQLRGRLPNTATVSPLTSTSSTHTGSPAMTSMGGFHFPPGMKPPTQQPQQHTLKSAVPAYLRTTSSTPQTGPTNALKRSADVMQAASSSSSTTRPPMQGMGLVQREHYLHQQQQQQQKNSVSRPPDNSEGNDPKRLKR